MDSRNISTSRTFAQLGTWSRLVLPFALPVALLLFLRANPHLDAFYRNARFHLLVVSTIAACALGVAIAAGSAAARSGHPGPVWLSFGCICVGALMLSHGLLTPGVLGHRVNTWISRAPYLGITLFAIGLFLAGRPRNTRTSRLAAQHATALLVLTILGFAALLATLVHNPLALGGDRLFPYELGTRRFLAFADCGTFVVLAVVHWRRWRLGRDPVQYSLVVAALMSSAALLSLQMGQLWRLAWWDYHVFLLVGFGGAVYAVWVRARRTSAVQRVLVHTFENDPLTHIVEGYPEALRALVRAVEVKDAYTHGHSQRTAQVAVQLGQRMQVNEDTLRILARGGYLHDVGKIAIPDSILNKPGKLDAEERAVIETHPLVGSELVSPVPSLREVLPVVLHHHERWDAGGYPDHLGGDAIPLVARIVAVADVWDALTSDRSYRAGFAPQVALGHIIDARGTHFDPQVVDAFVALAADWGYRPASNGDSSEAWRAAETCHEALASKA